jgi:hypothetical protein
MRLAVLILSVLVTAAALSFAADPPAAAPPAAIDWNKARELYQRERGGEKLSADDQAYLDRAKAERQRGQARPGGGGPLTPKESTGLVPLTNTAAPAQKYKDFSLGLYGDNQNAPPADHLKRATAAAEKIKPLDAKGQPAADGKIVLMSVGMSNTTQEFSRFVKLANDDPAKNPRLTIVDAAQGGKAADSWASAERAQTWEQADQRLARNEVTPAQVQVLWIKQARIGPAQLGEFPAHARALQTDLKNIVLLAKTRYPNLKLIYLSSRTYGGWATGPLNPEPYAYESAFSVQWLIRAQMTGEDKELADPTTPPLLWGPYLWTDGTKGRDLDKLTWQKADTANDGTHPSDAGRQKVAELLLTFFKSDPTAKTWFAK